MWLQLTNQNDQAINTDHVRRFKRGRTEHTISKKGAYTIIAVYRTNETEIFRSNDETERDNKYHELLQIISAVDW